MSDADAHDADSQDHLHGDDGLGDDGLGDDRPAKRDAPGHGTPATSPGAGATSTSTGATSTSTGSAQGETTPVLPGRSADDSDTGWGERPTDDDDERFLRDVPPHW